MFGGDLLKLFLLFTEMIFFLLDLSTKCAVYWSVTNSLLIDIIYAITNFSAGKSENVAVGLIKLIFILEF